MDFLKPVETIFEPDPRQLNWWIRNYDDGSVRQLTLEEHHANISRVILSDAVPEDVRQHMETAKNLALYSWYVYRFIPVAELQAYTALEWALRIRLEVADNAKPSFGGLLRRAIKQELITPADFKPLSETRPFATITGNSLFDANLPSAFHTDPRFMEAFYKGIVGLRNLLAHGSFQLWPDGTSTLAVVALAVNALFRAEERRIE